MVLSGQSIKREVPLFPIHKRTVFNGMSFGLSSAGYDIRIAEDVLLWPFSFQLASSVEKFCMPNDIVAVVHDKSTWARLGLSVQNTVIEPGWKGYLTLELKLQSFRFLRIKAGTPIAQVLFHKLDEPTDTPYNGKYQDQCSGPVKSILET